MKAFDKNISQDILNIEEKKRSNLFTWRGQFSPQLIECLLSSYCPVGSVVLDPFAGSGTVLFEAASMGLSAFGFEINPSAWSFCKLYEFANASHDLREKSILELREKIQAEFPMVLFSEDYLSTEEVEKRIIRIGDSISDSAKVLCNALVVLIDIFKNQISNDFVQSKFYELVKLVRNLPYSKKLIKADLQDARCLPLENQSVDFVVTSPPYINVFNYHQNYRRSVEILGWDVLRVARSEIGSNRANRGNRFYTVVQYCIDMASAFQELSRVLKSGGRAVFIVGYESKVLGVPFYNADIVEEITSNLGMFDIVLRQKRVFKNRFGQEIREDILNLEKKAYSNGENLSTSVGQNVAIKALESASNVVPKKNKELLIQAISRSRSLYGTPLFDSTSYRNYQTREYVMLVKEDEKDYEMNNESVVLPTPHLAKLNALLKNRRLPAADKPRINKALDKYKLWISEMESVKPGRKGAVKKLVGATNRYKKFIELDLIFDSTDDFLYRQKGQLKLDNTILEEFLPQLMLRGLNLPKNTFAFGPQKTFSGLSFASGISNSGEGGQAILRTKDQDFVLGKRLYMMTSFNKDFKKAERMETHLGYVCAECKTNLDKTMFQEAVATSRDLKIAVPSSLYFLVCEFLDMTPISITSTYIDDVLIVRKTKRMSSNVRQEYRTAADRKAHRDEYIEFLEAAKYHADVFQRMIDKIQAMADDTDPTAVKVLKRGFF
ncbi:MAG: Bpu10I family restriction endonuclease [Spirochaetales bacterium]|nr:Bpu10I family restriction endonuclease [Spirochaetales bacterium]